jgi:alpha-L-fucosidase
MQIFVFGLPSPLKYWNIYTCSTGKIVKRKWENCMTIDKVAWTHRRKIQIDDVLTIEELLTEIAETVA